MEVEFDLIKGGIIERKQKEDPAPAPVRSASNIEENPFDFMDETGSANAGYFIAGCLVLFTLVFGHWFGHVFGLIAAMILTAAAHNTRGIWLLRKKYVFVAKLTQPVFITSRYPGDDTVYHRRTIAEALIRSAWVDNKYAPVPPVYALYSGDEGETAEEWEERKQAFKVEQTKAYHMTIKSRNEGYYYRFILGQKDYPWEEVEQR